MTDRFSHLSPTIRAALDRLMPQMSEVIGDIIVSLGLAV